jgi:hypothetical protein
MILFSHPRAGTEWFLRGLVDYHYCHWEMFNPINQIPGTVENRSWGTITFASKIRMLRVGATTDKSFKIHFYDLAREMTNDTWPVLKEAIDLHDHYRLTRRDTKAAVISALLAKFNDHNYHRHHFLDKTGIIKKHEVLITFRNIYTDTYDATPLLNYKEEFIYEDLVDKTYIPKTLNWNPAISNTIQRKSFEMVNLIDNKEEVLGWIDELIQVNQVQSHP